MPISLRLGLFFAAIFVGVGVSSPYIGAWFDAHGLNGKQIGLILAAPGMARIVSGPMLAVWADGFRLRRTPMAILAAVSVALYVAFVFARGFWAWAVLWLAVQTVFAAITPLADVIALRRAARDGFNYGFSRGLGSVAFIVANIAMGVILSIARPDAIMVWIIASAGACAACAWFALPDDPVHEAGEASPRADRWRGLGALALDPVFLLVVVSAGLVQASHAFYYGFSVLTWRAQGVPPSLSGVLWAVGVAAEVGFFWFLEPWRRAVGPERLLMLGALGAVARWTCYALSPPLVLLFPLQTLHALSYCATFVGSLTLIERHTPARSASSAQTLNAAVTGVISGLTSIGAGALFDAFGPYGYFAMAGVAGLGLAGALALPTFAARQKSLPA